MMRFQSEYPSGVRGLKKPHRQREKRQRRLSQGIMPMQVHNNPWYISRVTPSNPVPVPDQYFDSFSYPVATIVFGDMAVVSLFLLLLFLANPQILSGKLQARSISLPSSVKQREMIELCVRWTT